MLFVNVQGRETANTRSCTERYKRHTKERSNHHDCRQLGSTRCSTYSHRNVFRESDNRHRKVHRISHLQSFQLRFATPVCRRPAATNSALRTDFGPGASTVRTSSFASIKINLARFANVAQELHRGATIIKETKNAARDIPRRWADQRTNEARSGNGTR